VFAFVNTGVSDAASLVAKIQKLVDANKELKACVVFTGGPALKAQIAKLGADQKTTIPLVYLPNGSNDAGIATYKINPQAKTTILLSKSNTIRANFVNLDPNQFDQVATAAKKMLSSG
jgi:hypothetical protein